MLTFFRNVGTFVTLFPPIQAFSNAFGESRMAEMSTSLDE